MNKVNEKISKLISFLEAKNLSKEAHMVRKIAAGTRTYTVTESDSTLGAILQREGVSMEQYKELNPGANPNLIIPGRTKIILPTLYTDQELVAATLMGEGGSVHGESSMKRIMAVIVNRANNTGKTHAQVVDDPVEFEYWSRYPKPGGVTRFRDNPNTSKLWEAAMTIADPENPVVSSEVGQATYYYNPNEVKRTPIFAREDNKCWEVIFTADNGHVFGRGGVPWDRCYPEMGRD